MPAKRISMTVAGAVGAPVSDAEAVLSTGPAACTAGGAFRVVLRLDEPAVLASVVVKNARSAFMRVMVGGEDADVANDRGYRVLVPLRQLVASPAVAVDRGSKAAEKVRSLRAGDFNRFERGRKVRYVALDCFPFHDGPGMAGVGWVQVYGDADAPGAEPAAGGVAPPRRSFSVESPAKAPSVKRRIDAPRSDAVKRMRAEEEGEEEAEAAVAAGGSEDTVMSSAGPDPGTDADADNGNDDDDVREVRKKGPDYGRRFRVLPDGSRQWLDDPAPAAVPAPAAPAPAGAPFAIKEVKGDLFSSADGVSLAHCVSADMRMGKGIAKIFLRKFGGVDALKSQGAGVGGVAFIQPGRRHVFVLVTKKVYHQKPTLAALEQSLGRLRTACDAEGVRELAMPRIGCGLDGLKWPDVRPLIEEAFRGGSTNVTVYTL